MVELVDTLDSKSNAYGVPVRVWPEVPLSILYLFDEFLAGLSLAALKNKFHNNYEIGLSSISHKRVDRNIDLFDYLM